MADNRPNIPAGVWPVMLTPFTADLEIDWAGLDALTDWYIAMGVAGLFAVCLSSEMYALEPQERLALAEHVVRRAAGRVPVVASGTFGGPLVEQAAVVRQMAATGVDAVVVIANQLAGPDGPEATWQSAASRLLDLTPGVDLGLYECPVPYHRLLSPEMLGWAARSERFLFHKDTCCRIGPIRSKIAAARGTPFRFFNAHTPTLLASLQSGGHGYSGTAANMYPELLVWLCQHYVSEPETATRLQHLLSVCDRAAAHKYPTVAKECLAALGLPIGPHCRVSQVPLDEPDRTILGHLLALVSETRVGLGLS